MQIIRDPWVRGERYCSGRGEGGAGGGVEMWGWREGRGFRELRFGVLLGVYHGIDGKAVFFFGVYHRDLRFRRCYHGFGKMRHTFRGVGETGMSRGCTRMDTDCVRHGARSFCYRGWCAQFVRTPSGANFDKGLGARGLWELFCGDFKPKWRQVVRAFIGCGRLRARRLRCWGGGAGGSFGEGCWV